LANFIDPAFSGIGFLNHTAAWPVEFPLCRLDIIFDLEIELIHISTLYRLFY